MATYHVTVSYLFDVEAKNEEDAFDKVNVSIRYNFEFAGVTYQPEIDVWRESYAETEPVETQAVS